MMNFNKANADQCRFDLYNLVILVLLCITYKLQIYQLFWIKGNFCDKTGLKKLLKLEKGQ